jgi:hypothetical protein
VKSKMRSITSKPGTHLLGQKLRGGGGGGGGGGVYSESYTRGGAIPDEMGSARCRATPALNQSADETLTPASQCLPVMPLPRRVTLVPRQREPTTPPLELVTWSLGGVGDWVVRRLHSPGVPTAPLELGVWVVSRVSLAGIALCPLAGRPGGSGWLRWEGVERQPRVRHHIEVGWMHGEEDESNTPPPCLCLFCSPTCPVRLHCPHSSPVVR